MNNNGVSIITCTCKPNCFKTIMNNYLRQNFSPKELIIVINNNSIDINIWIEKTSRFNDIRILRTDESVSLGESLNYGISEARFDHISKFDDDDYYGPEYLANTIKAFKHSGADIVGKSNIFVYFIKTEMLSTHKRGMENSSNNNFIAGATISFKKEVFNKVKFQHLQSGEDRAFVAECLASGLKLYSTDINDYVCIRHGEVEKHTWKIEDEAFMQWCNPVKKIKETDLYDIINKIIKNIK